MRGLSGRSVNHLGLSARQKPDSYRLDMSIDAMELRKRTFVKATPQLVVRIRIP